MKARLLTLAVAIAAVASLFAPAPDGASAAVDGVRQYDDGCLIVGSGDQGSTTYTCGECDSSGTLKVEVYVNGSPGASAAGIAQCIYQAPRSKAVAKSIAAECTATVPAGARFDECTGWGSQIAGVLTCTVAATVPAGGTAGWYVRCKKV
jgi:hypothetical protein